MTTNLIRISNMMTRTTRHILTSLHTGTTTSTSGSTQQVDASSVAATANAIRPPSLRSD